MPHHMPSLWPGTAIIANHYRTASGTIFLTTIRSDRFVNTSCRFIFIGQTPNSHLLKDLVELDDGGHAKVDLRMHTTVPGLFVAGDLRMQSARQLVSACGDGATASLAAEAYLSEAGLGEG